MNNMLDYNILFIMYIFNYKLYLFLFNCYKAFIQYNINSIKFYLLLNNVKLFYEEFIVLFKNLLKWLNMKIIILMIAFAWSWKNKYSKLKKIKQMRT